jgi:hypothetical protein
MQRYTYKVVEVREKMIGGKMSGDKLLVTFERPVQSS